MANPAAAQAHSHKRVTGLSGNEIYCLNSISLKPGTLCLGNSVFSLGLMGSISSGFKTLAGGEIEQITALVHEGRSNSLKRMQQEAQANGGVGITGVSTELIVHASNIEFLTIGSVVHSTSQADRLTFSTSADAQELYCQIDAGFTPLRYVFGNVAYSIGVGGGFGGILKSLQRGEVSQFTEIFDKTRHLALARISQEAKQCGANAVLGIETNITPLMGAQEMVMIGTASSHPLLQAYKDNPVTSDMTNQEMWNMVQIGYAPIRLVMGVSVYSLGLTGGITSTVRSFARGEINELTSLLYEAREKSLDRIERDAEHWGADEVVGVKTHVYELGGGLIEFLAIGTAVKKIDGLTTKNPQLPPQAIIQDKDTYFESAGQAVELSSRASASAGRTQGGPLRIVVFLIVIAFYVLLSIFGHGKH